MLGKFNPFRLPLFFCGTPKLAELNAAAFKKAPFSVATLCIWGKESCGIIGILKNQTDRRRFPPNAGLEGEKISFKFRASFHFPVRSIHLELGLFGNLRGKRRCFFSFFVLIRNTFRWRNYNPLSQRRRRKRRITSQGPGMEFTRILIN